MLRFSLGSFHLSPQHLASIPIATKTKAKPRVEDGLLIVKVVAVAVAIIAVAIIFSLLFSFNASRDSSVG